MNSTSKPRIRACEQFTLSAVRLCTVTAVLASLVTANGLSDEVVVNRQWRDLEGTTSLSINPSLPGYTERPTFSATMASTQWGSFMLVNSQVTIPLTSTMKWSQTLGVGITGFSSGDIEKTDWVRGKIVRDNDGINYSEVFGTICYALRPLNALTAGINLNLARQSNFGAPIIDGSFDLGVSYHYENARIGSHLFGISLLNPAGISQYEKPVYTPDLGVSWSMMSPQITDDITMRGGIDANIRSFWGDNLGSPRKDVSARIGVTIRNTMTCYLQAGKYYVGLAAKIDLDTTWRPLAMQFRNTKDADNEEKTLRLTQFHKASAGYQMLKTEKQFRPTNTLYLSTEFGKERDEGDNCFEMYHKAQKFYRSCNFWEAYGYFSVIERDCPDFQLIDEVRMRAAYCLEQLEQNKKAEQKYAEVKSSYKNRSAHNDGYIIGAADLGLYRLLAEGTDSATAENQYKLLTRSSAADTLKTIGMYLRGLAGMRHENVLEALQSFDEITDTTHPVFPFVQYTKGTCFASQDKMASATESFDAVLQFEKKYRQRFNGCHELDALDEIIYKSRYALGVKNYEQFREHAHKLLICDSIRNDVMTAIGSAINFIDAGRSDYALVCPVKDTNTLSNDSVIVRASARTLMYALSQAIGSMDYLEIGTAFQMGKDSLTVSIDNVASDINNGGTELLAALRRLSGASISADRKCAIWLTDVSSQVHVVFEQVALKSAGDTLVTQSERCKLTIKNSPSWTRNSVEDVLGVSKKYAALLEQTKSALQGIPETSTWGADVLYLAAWVFYQMKNWKACEVVIEMIEERASQKEYHDVQPYMLADLTLMKTVTLRKVESAPVDRETADLKRIELGEKADSIMTNWLSTLGITRSHHTEMSNTAISAEDSLTNAQIDSENETRIRDLLDSPKRFKMVLEDSIKAAMSKLEKLQGIQSEKVEESISKFRDELEKKEGESYVNMGKLIENIILQYSKPVYDDLDTILEIQSTIAQLDHQRAYVDLIISIVTDIKKSNYSTGTATGTMSTPTINVPVAPVLREAPVQVQKPAAPVESEAEMWKRKVEELEKKLLLEQQKQK